ncbi:MAG TPA: winged helix-turn-helix domain-containing protein [Candidatus Acidoferrales bacterium]|nr:winged helix-turn-helix domain-containing protein [Candidatus Acidoferrales bacterium]
MFEEHFLAQFPEDTRKEEINKIVAYVKKGNSCQLVGIPGVNRSTVLGLMVYNKKIREKHLGTFQDESHFVLVDFSEIRNRPLADVMKYLFLNLTESLRERGMKEENQAVGDIFREHLKFQDEFLLFQGFKEAVDYLSLEKKISIVFLFDRFEEYVPTVTTDFFSNLRILRNRGKYRFSVVFSVNKPLEDVLDPASLADYYEFIADRIVQMNLFDKPSSDFWLANIEKLTHKKIPEQTVRQILKLTGGHGLLTKLSFETVIGQDLAKNLEQFLLGQKIIKKSLTEIWQSFSPAEQADLLEEKFEDRDIAEYLEQVGLVTDSHIQIPLFTAFIATEYKDVAKSLQKISYDEHTNSIRKGSTVLSDQLTSSEFRLLRYLLQNEGRVIERDELISIVWGDNKSTAGITDQAVDQLIFRVRRKIEEDANHPVHLQTVKGRGFTFTS